MTIEIPQDRWSQFFARLSAEEAILVDIRVQSDGDLRLVAQGSPLQSLTFETGDACNNSLAIEFGSAKAGALQFQIVEPIRLVLRKESSGDHYNLLEISAESGTTAITFHPGISPALLVELNLPQLPPAA